MIEDLFFGLNRLIYRICEHCNGYGSSLKDPIDVNTCTKCGGIGVIDKLVEAENKTKDKSNCQ